MLNTEQPATEYRDVPGFPGYRVGDDGSVWSRWQRVKPTAFKGGGVCEIGDQWRLLKPGQDRSTGYLRVVVCAEGRRRACLRVHVLVLTVFVGPPPERMVAAHGNGVRTDNRLCNLRWATRAENSADMVRHGTVVRGVACHMHKLTDDVVRESRRRRAAGETISRLAAEYGVTPSTLSVAIAGKTWKHVREDSTDEVCLN